MAKDEENKLERAKRLIDEELSKGIALSNQAMYLLLESNLNFDRLSIDKPSPLQKAEYREKLHKEKRALVSETMRWIRRQIVIRGLSLKDYLGIERVGRIYKYSYKKRGFSVYSDNPTKSRIKQLDIALNSISCDKRLRLLDEDKNSTGIILPSSIKSVYEFRKQQLQSIQSKAEEEINSHNREIIRTLIKVNKLNNRMAVCNFLEKLGATDNYDCFCYLGLCHELVIGETTTDDDIKFYADKFCMMFSEHNDLKQINACRIMYAQVLSVLFEIIQSTKNIFECYNDESLLLEARGYLISNGQDLIPISKDARNVLLRIYRQLIDVFEYQQRDFAAKDMVSEAFDMVSKYDVETSWDKAYILCQMSYYYNTNNGAYNVTSNIETAKSIINKLPKEEMSFFFESFIIEHS